jgi:putative hydrolase of the HAD superfamily
MYMTAKRRSVKLLHRIEQQTRSIVRIVENGEFVAVSLRETSPAASLAVAAEMALPARSPIVILGGMRQSPIQVVVFDAVGTLIFPQPKVAAAYTAVAHRLGSTLSETEIGSRFHEAFRDEEARDHRGDGRTSEEIEVARWRRIVGRVCSDVNDHERCFSELFAHFARAESWAPFSDVTNALAALRGAGYRIAVASNLDARIHAILGSVGSAPAFDFVLPSSQIGFRKPHRCFFDAVVARAGVPPSAILYVGDDPYNDLRGAREAGLSAVLIDRRGRNGAGSIPSLTELLGCLEEWGALAGASG